MRVRRQGSVPLGWGFGARLAPLDRGDAGMRQRLAPLDWWDVGAEVVLGLVMVMAEAAGTGGCRNFGDFWAGLFRRPWKWRIL